MTVSPGRFSPSPSGGFLLQFEQTYPTDPDDLWNAITDARRLRRWMAHYEGDLVLGGAWRALFDDGSIFTTGVVTACDAPRSFVTTWNAVGESETTLTVTLTALDGGTRLTLDHDAVGSPDYGPGWQTYFEVLELEVLGEADCVAAFDWNRRYRELRGLARPVSLDERLHGV